MIRVLKWVAGLIFENFFLKLLSVALAILIWGLVASEPEVAQFASVPLQFKNLPDNIEISSEPVTVARLELRGPESVLRSIGQEGGFRPGIVLDMSGVSPGERTFPIGDANVRVTRGIRLIRSIPSSVQFAFEERGRKSIPVAVRFGDAPAGYTLEGYQVNPREMTVAGPNSRVQRLDRVTTDPIDLSGVVGKAEFRVNTFVNDPYVRFVSTPQVTVEVRMRRR
jgi:YbbR domain-containing protein